MMANLRRGWAYTTIGEVTTNNVAQRRPKSEEEFRYIDISSIDRETKQIIEPQQLLGENAPSRARRVVSVSDVLVSMTRPNLNAVAMVPLELDGQIASTGLHVLRPVLIDPRWLFYLVRSNDFISTMSALAQGVVYPAIRSKDLRAYQIPLAPLNEQRRIADKLDTLQARVDACRARLERVSVVLKRFRQAVLAAATSGELTEDLRQDEEPWRKSKLGSLLADIRYGTSKKSSYELKNGSPVLRIPNIQDRRIDPSDMKYGYFNKKEIKNLVLKTGDLLIIRSNGSLALVGKVAIVEPEFEGYLFAGYLIRLRVDTSIIMPNYLSLYLSSPKIRKHIELTARSTNGINNINSKEIQAIQVELPTLEEQYEIIRRVEVLFTYADRLERHTQAAYNEVEQLTPALLDKAFRGELVPQDPNDEPASVLLERIQAKQAMQPDKPKRTRRPKRSQMSKKSVKKAIDQLPEDKFSFDELRHHLTGNYDQLKKVIFSLLDETEPRITQLFYEKLETMLLVRSNK